VLRNRASRRPHHFPQGPRRLATRPRKLGRTPGNITAIRPMKTASSPTRHHRAMLRYFIKKVHNNSKVVSPRVVVAIPSGITESRNAPSRNPPRTPAREVITILDPCRRSARPARRRTGRQHDLHIGGGTTEIAIISLSGIVFPSPSASPRRVDSPSSTT